uniref:Uncharacterized protein n=1 Tax=Mycena chlorophos TaxID=658473 RepID=A0ABQ0L389_MYCCL|nr:predicted protein [Mycena chlorophos]
MSRKALLRPPGSSRSAHLRYAPTTIHRTRGSGGAWWMGAATRELGKFLLVHVLSAARGLLAVCPNERRMTRPRRRCESSAADAPRHGGRPTDTQSTVDGQSGVWPATSTSAIRERTCQANKLRAFAHLSVKPQGTALTRAVQESSATHRAILY